MIPAKYKETLIRLKSKPTVKWTSVNSPFNKICQ